MCPTITTIRKPAAPPKTRGVSWAYDADLVERAGRSWRLTRVLQDNSGCESRSCTCPSDRHGRGVPCKHRLALAAALSAIGVNQ